MMVLITYDLADDKTRRQVAKLLGSYGTRVQRSVFECHLSKKECNDLEARLTDCLEAVPDGDPLSTCSVRLYLLCARCSPKIRLLGRSETSTDPPECFVA